MRKERVSEEIRKVIAKHLITTSKTFISSLVTINRVVSSPDLSHAKVFFSAYADDDEIEQIRLSLKANKNIFRKKISQEMRLKYIPDLMFVKDESVQKTANLLRLIQEKKTI